MKKVSVAAAAAAALLLLLLAAATEGSELKLGYYAKTCRGWENVVKYHVAKAIRANRASGAALVRLIFHDCFVRVRTYIYNSLAGSPPAAVVIQLDREKGILVAFQKNIYTWLIDRNNLKLISYRDHRLHRYQGQAHSAPSF